MGIIIHPCPKFHGGLSKSMTRKSNLTPQTTIDVITYPFSFSEYVIKRARSEVYDGDGITILLVYLDKNSQRISFTYYAITWTSH